LEKSLSADIANYNFAGKHANTVTLNDDVKTNSSAYILHNVTRYALRNLVDIEKYCPKNVWTFFNLDKCVAHLTVA